MKRIFFIDFENVAEAGLAGFFGLRPEDIVYLFYSQRSNKISIDFIRTLMAGENLPHLEFLRVDTGNQALDFQLSSFLGASISDNGLEDSYTIISRDKGYFCLLTFWKRLKGDLHLTQAHSIKESLPYRNAEVSAPAETSAEPAFSPEEELSVAEEAAPIEVPEAGTVSTVPETVLAEEPPMMPDEIPETIDFHEESVASFCDTPVLENDLITQPDFPTEEPVAESSPAELSESFVPVSEESTATLESDPPASSAEPSDPAPIAAAPVTAPVVVPEQTTPVESVVEAPAQDVPMPEAPVQEAPVADSPVQADSRPEQPVAKNPGNKTKGKKPAPKAPAAGAEKINSSANRIALNSQIQQILSREKYENSVVATVASLATKALGEPNIRQKVYRTMIANFGQKQGLEIYNLIKPLIK